MSGMTPERLAEIRAWVAQAAYPEDDCSIEHELLAEIDRLRAEDHAREEFSWPKPKARLIDWCRLCGFEYSKPGMPPAHDCTPTNGTLVRPAPGHLTRDCINGDVPGLASGDEVQP